MRTDTKTLIEALRKIPDIIHDGEGLVSATILEGADRLEVLEELEELNEFFLKRGVGTLGNGWVFTPDRQEAMTIERFDQLAEEGSEEIDKFADWENAKRGNK
ncbi:hypothetical protein H8E06_00060 [bacterium]|nr:hypothetical protein [bacterium]